MIKKQKYYVENTHPAIISGDIHDLVINEIKHRELMSSEQKQKDGRESVRFSLDKNCNYSSKYYLSNIMTCEDCGSPFRRYTWTARGTTKYVWMCEVRKTKGGRKTCPLSPSIEEKDLHFAIVHAINVAAKNIEIEDESSIVEDNVQFNLKKLDECINELELLNQKLQVAVANNESEDTVIDIKYEISLLNLELAKFKYLNQQIKSTEDQLSRSTISMNKYSDELLKLYVRSIKVTNKGDLKITFKSGLEMQAACRCTLASV